VLATEALPWSENAPTQPHSAQVMSPPQELYQPSDLLPMAPQYATHPSQSWAPPIRSPSQYHPSPSAPARSHVGTQSGAGSGSTPAHEAHPTSESSQQLYHPSERVPTAPQ
jgi:hypothetical protein